MQLPQLMTATTMMMMMMLQDAAGCYIWSFLRTSHASHPRIGPFSRQR